MFARVWQANTSSSLGMVMNLVVMLAFWLDGPMQDSRRRGFCAFQVRILIALPREITGENIPR